MSDNYDTYRVTSGYHYKDGVRFGPGDVVPLTPDEVSGNEFKLEHAPDAEPTADGQQITVEPATDAGRTHRLEEAPTAAGGAAGGVRERTGSANSSTVDRGVDVQTEADETGENQTDTDVTPDSVTPDREGDDLTTAGEGDVTPSQEGGDTSDGGDVTPSQESDDGGETATEGEEGNENGAVSLSDADEADGDALERFVDRNVGPVEEAIAAGEADGYLDEIEEAEKANRDRVSIEEAIEQRRQELDESEGN